MMLTDKHERRGSKLEAQTARHTHSQRSHSRYGVASSVAHACQHAPSAGRACRQHVGMQHIIHTTLCLVWPRAERGPPVATEMLPGSLWGSQAEGEQELPLMQQHQQRGASHGQDRTNSLTNHVLHGVKSGAWDMKAHMMEPPVFEAEEEEED